jgi:hypothetical protein
MSAPDSSADVRTITVAELEARSLAASAPGSPRACAS